MTPDRAAAERMAREIVTNLFLSPHATGNAAWLRSAEKYLTTALLTWGTQRWREAIEQARREVWTRKCLPLCSHPECTRLRVADDAIRALLPPPVDVTPGDAREEG